MPPNNPWQSRFVLQHPHPLPVLPFSIQDSQRGKLLMAAITTHNAKPTQPPSVIYKAALNPTKVITADLLTSQQTPEGVYSMLLTFTSSGPMIRNMCGHGGCRATANPTESLPVTCTSKIHPHVHNKYDMVPVLFTVVPHNCAHDIGPMTLDGTPIPASFSVSTQVLCSSITLIPLHVFLYSSWDTFLLQLFCGGVANMVFHLPLLLPHTPFVYLYVCLLRFNACKFNFGVFLSPIIPFYYFHLPAHRAYTPRPPSVHIASLHFFLPSPSPYAPLISIFASNTLPYACF